MPRQYTLAFLVLNHPFMGNFFILQALHLINGLFTGLRANCLLFPLNSCRGFAGNIIYYPIYMIDFIYYPI